MKFEYLSYASTEPGYCCLMYIQAIAHRAFCSRKPEEVVLDSSDAADHRSVMMKAIPIVGYSNGMSCMKYSESSICLLIALQRVVYTQAPTTQSRITKDYSEYFMPDVLHCSSVVALHFHMVNCKFSNECSCILTRTALHPQALML